MTFTYVNFKFSASARRPCLPVRTSKQRGLVYPRVGASWCCGPELVVARDLGAEIKVLSGWRIDWTTDNIRPLEGYAQMINQLRAEAKAAGDAIREQTLKEIGNSGYGKAAQAVASMRVIQDDIVFRKTFDAKWSKTDELGPSAISQPMLAAFTTSIVRANLSEAINRLPRAWLGTATTDGMLFTGAMSDLDETGPVARAFKAARARITPDDHAMWDLKHAVPRVVVTKTRGTFTDAPPDWTGKPVIARGGFSFPTDQDDKHGSREECANWIKMLRERNYNTKIERSCSPPYATSTSKGKRSKGSPPRFSVERRPRPQEQAGQYPR